MTEQENSGNGDEIKRTVDLMVEAFDTSIRSYFSMMRLPLVCYATAMKTWNEAVESAIKSCKPEEGEGNGGGNGGNGGS